MKAVRINTYGGSEVLEVSENVLIPSPSKNQILVKVYASGINPVDWKIRAGFLKEMAPLQFPATLGGDFAGIVTGLGEGVTGFKIGDEVFGQAIVLNGGSGSFAEFVRANVANSAIKPKRLSFEEAGALPLVGTSAIQALVDHIKLKKGEKILIHGGAGGIGHIAIQLAKAIGAYVATTVSAKNIDFAKQLGADEAIDYKNQEFDAVFDTVGNSTWETSFEVLKKGGIIVSMLGQPNPQIAEQKGITSIGQGTQTNTDRLNRLTSLIDSGRVKVHIDKVFNLKQIKEAFDYFEQEHPRGKVVIKIK